MKRKKVNQLLAMALATSMSVSMVPATAYAASEQTGENVGVVQEEQKSSEDATSNNEENASVEKDAKTPEVKEQTTQVQEGDSTSVNDDETNDASGENDVDAPSDADTETLKGDCGAELHWELTKNDDSENIWRETTGNSDKPYVYTKDKNESADVQEEVSTYTLKITGTGAMDDYTRASTPWGNALRDKLIADGDKISKEDGIDFSVDPRITHIEIDEGITYIGAHAFRSTGISEITIPASVENIGNYAMIRCENLTGIKLAGENENRPFYVEDGALYEKYKTEDGKSGVVLRFYPPAKITETVVVPEGVTAIGPNSMQDGKFTSVKLPSTLRSIDSFSFVNTKISSITLPDGVQFGTEAETGVAGSGVFSGCTELTEVNNFPEVAKIPATLFASCGKMENFTIPSSVTEIGDAAFRNSGIKEIIIPSSVTTFGTTVFAAKSKETTDWGVKLTFEKGSQLQSVGKDMFAGRASNNATFNPEDMDAYNVYTSAGYSAELSGQAIPTSEDFIYSWKDNDTLKITGLTDEGKQKENLVIPDVVESDGKTYKVVEITDGLCKQADAKTGDTSILKSVVIGANVEKIGDRAFMYCRNLKSIDCSKATSLKTIGANAFYYIAEGQTLDLTKSTGLESIGENAFWYSNLKALKLPGSMISFGKNATAKSTNVYIENNKTTLAALKEALKNSTADYRFGIIGTYENLAYRTVGNGEDFTITITGFADGEDADRTKIEIPDEIEGFKVTEVAARAFDGNDAKINPDYTKLKSIVIGANVEKIGEYAFEGNLNNADENLESITFKAGVPITVGTRAFQKNNGNSKVVFDGSNRQITFENNAFLDTKVVSAYMPNVKKIGKGLFYNSDSLKTLVINANAECDDYAFYKSTSAASTSPSLSNTTVYAVNSADVAEQIKAIPSTGKNKLVIANGGIFADDAVFDSTELPEPTKKGMKFAGWYTTEDCTGDAVTSVENQQTVYAKYEELTGDCSATEADHVNWKLLLNEDSDTYTLTISGTGNMKDYSGTDRPAWYDKIAEVSKIVVEDGVASIGNAAFSGCNNVSDVELPEGLTSIGEYAFECLKDSESKLTQISLPTTVSEIGAFAFMRTSITEITLPDSVTKIANGTFKFADKLQKVTANSVTGVGNQAFDSCTALEQVDAEKITAFGDNAFNKCESLQNITIADGTTTIGTATFSGCTSLKEVVIPDGVTTIGKKAFDGCSSLKKVTLPNTVTTMGASKNAAFSNPATFIITGTGVVEAHATSAWSTGIWTVNKAAVEKLVLSEGITEIGESTFRGLTELKSVELPSTINAIGNYAFWGESALQSLDMHKITSAITWGTNTAIENGSSSFVTYVADETMVSDVKNKCTANTQKQNIILVVNGGDVEATKDAFDSVTRDGYELVGWYENADFTGDAATAPEAGKTYYAKWLKENVTLTATSRSTTDETPVSDVSLTDEDGNAVTTPRRNTTVTATAKAKSGYKFVGWYKNSYEQDQKPVSEKLVYKFTADDDMTLIAVYEASESVNVKITGSKFTVVVNGEEQLKDTNYWDKSVNVGSIVTVTATDDAFIGWENASSKIVSRQEGYTFVVTGETSLSEISKMSDNNTAFVEFVSDYDQVIEAGTYRADSIITLPDTIPSKPGYEAQRWSMTAEEIKAAIESGVTQHITVKPVYTAKTDTKHLGVYVDETEVEDSELSKDVNVGSTVTVSAPAEVNGKTFAYWAADADGNTVLGYDKDYFTIVNADMNIYAVYSTGAEAAKPMISMTDISAMIDGNANKLVFTATRNVPKGYTLIEQGVLYGINSTKENYVIGNTAVRQMISSDKKANGVYIAYINVGSQLDTRVYATGYMIVENAATGNQEVIYTDVVDATFNESINRR